MTETFYIAAWYGVDAISDGTFIPDRVSESTHPTQLEAQDAAIAGAEKSWTQGWARVTEVNVVKGQNEYGPELVNEYVFGEWEGWWEREN